MTNDDLIFAANRRCSCGAGLARLLDPAPDEPLVWDCSAVLRGAERIEKKHITPRKTRSCQYATELMEHVPTTRDGGLSDAEREWLLLKLEGTVTRERIRTACELSALPVRSIELSRHTVASLAALYGSPAAAREDLGIEITVNRDLDQFEILVVAYSDEVEPIAG